MTSSEVVSDTGPLISLEKMAGGFRLLARLFDKVYIPREVSRELKAGYAGSDYLRDHGLEEVAEIVVVRPIWTGSGAERLDAGERAAIGLAVNRRLPLLIEERLGRRLAREAGIDILGATGLVYRAFRRRLLEKGEAERMVGELYESRRIGRRLFEGVLDRIEDDPG